MIKNLDNLADRLKGIKVDGEDITPSKLKELISSDDELELTIDKVNLFDENELNQLKNNSYKEGLTFGTEKLVKAFRNVNELNFEGIIKHDNDGKVDFEGLAKHISEPFTEKIKSQNTKPNELAKEWESKYTTLKSTYETEKESYENKVKTLSNELGDISKTQFLVNNMPELSGIKKQQAVILFKNDYQIEQRENDFIAKKGNEIVKDNLGNPLPIKEVANLWAVDNGWLKDAGRGDGNNPDGKTSKFKNEEEAYAYMRKENIPPDSPEAGKILEQVAQD